MTKDFNAPGFRPWTAKTFGQALAGMCLVFAVLMLYNYLYDILWIKIGYIFIYFGLFFLTLVAFWVSIHIRTKGIGTFLFGVPNFAFIPACIYFESIPNPIMVSPWGAVIWALNFTAIGLSLDIGLWAFKPQTGKNKAIFLSSLLFAVVILGGTMISLWVIYVSLQDLTDFLAFGYFLIPFALAEGILGGFAGCFLAIKKGAKTKSTARIGNRQEWYLPWTKGAVGWVLIGVGIVSCLIGAFTFFFDVYFMKIGYIFIYYVLPYAGFFTYYLAARLQIKGIGLIIFGLNGIIGIPLDLYFEWIEVQSLASPWGAVGWAAIYALYGLAMDLSLWLANPQNGESRAMVISNLVFAIATIFLSLLALMTLYKVVIPIPGATDVLTYAYFLIPSATLETMLAGYISSLLASSRQNLFSQKSFAIVDLFSPRNVPNGNTGLG